MRTTLRTLVAASVLVATTLTLGGLAATAQAAPRIDPHTGHGSSGDTSLNWAGYSATGAGGFTSVTATWTQPTVAATSNETYAAFWVGLDGDGSDTVEQIGTMGYTYGGHAYYTAWYEMYPDAMQEITTMTIEPGDVLTGGVRWAGSTAYVLKLTDKTSGKTFTTTQTSSAAERASAEIIAEAPASSISGDVLQLATFGLVTFSGCAIDEGTLAAADASSITMVDSNGATIAATSELGDDDSSFTVTDDFTGPTTTVSGTQSSATTGWKNHAVTVTLSASDGSGGSGVAAVFYTLDGGETQTYEQPFSVTRAGSHKLRCWAVDAAGNTGSVRTRYVNIDLSAPSSQAAAVGVKRAATAKGALIKAPVTVTDALPTSGTVTLVTRITTSSGATVAKTTRTAVPVNQTTTVRLRLKTSLKRGTYYLRTLATDAAGNVQARAGKATLKVR